MSIYLSFYEFIDFLRCMNEFYPSINIAATDIISLKYSATAQFKYIKGYPSVEKYDTSYSTNSFKNIKNLIYSNGKSAEFHKAILDPENGKFVRSERLPEGSNYPIFNYEDILSYYTKDGYFKSFASMARFFEIYNFIVENIEDICNNGIEFTYFPFSAKFTHGKYTDMQDDQDMINYSGYRQSKCIERRFLRENRQIHAGLQDICLPDFSKYGISPKDINTCLEFILFPGSRMIQTLKDMKTIKPKKVVCREEDV